MVLPIGFTSGRAGGGDFAPINTVAPSISGNAVIDSTLTVSNGTWDGEPEPTFTYQWQRGTTNISGATNSSYTVTLGDANSTIRCQVTATNSEGSVSAFSASTSTVQGLDIGASYQGGFYAGQTGYGGTTYAIICSPRATGQSYLAIKTSRTSTSGTTSTVDGFANTNAMISAGASDHPAADFVNDLTIGGYSDWYIPAKNEVTLLYNNLARSETSATAFQTGGSEAFTTLQYWSSSESSSTSNHFRIFSSTGTEATNVKDNPIYVRAIRRVAI